MDIFDLRLVANLGFVGCVFVIAPALVQAWDIGRMLDQALESAHITRKEAADAMGVTTQQLSRMLAGVGPEALNAQRMTRLPKSAWLHLLLAIGEHFALVPSADQRAVHTAAIQMRMAKAALRAKEDTHAA